MSQRDALRDPDTEAALLGACLASTQAIDDVRGIVAASDFAAGRHQATWQAICAELDAHGDVDILGVAARLDEPEIHLWLRELMIDTPAISAAPSYAARIVDMTARRGLVFAADEITKLARNTGESAGDAIDRAQHLLASVDMPIPDASPDPDIDSFLGDVDDRYDWLIPGFLERRDRFLLTAGEGVGKSVLLAQIGVMAAAGIHPWTRKNIEPCNVAIVDLENGPRLLKRRIGAMRHVAGGKLDPGRLRIAAHPDGIDLTTRSGRRWLLERCTANRTDLLVIGPAYRLMAGVAERGDIGGEDMTRKVTAALDEIRNRCNVTLLMETHAPHGDGFGRNLRPFGSSVWLRWPEFGLGITRDRDDPVGIYQFTRWRGDRDERQWPKRLKRTGMTGRDWPWQALDYDDGWHSASADAPEGAIA